MTGETRHPAQVLKYMEEAGPGATESRTYQAIVAEVERRKDENAPAPAATGDEGKENQPDTQERPDSTVTVPNPVRLDDFVVTAIESRAVVDMSVDTENGLDVALEHNVEADEAGEVVEAYYRVVLTPHAGRNTSMLQISPHKIPELVAMLNELHDAWQQDVQLATLRGVTVTDVIAAAQARGMKASDVLAELLEQAGIDVGKAA
ncbi:hypothetical protein GS448_15860 [Rhodococcus hoagii]|nr:hypothetical protein [Prescottella equi]